MLKLVKFIMVAYLVSGASCLYAQTPANPEDDSPEALYRKGLVAFTSGNYPEAIRSFQTLADRFGNELSLAKEMESVFYALGCAQYNQGSYTEAVKAFETYLQKFPGARFSDEVMFRIGAAYQSEQTYEKAVVMYLRLIAENPASSFAEDAAFQIGVCYLLENNNEKAAEAFERMAALYPESELVNQAIVFRARALFESGKLEPAVNVLKLLEGRGRNLDQLAYANFLAMEIGDAAFDNTDYDLALRAYRRVQTRESLLRIQQRYTIGVQESLDALARQSPGGSIGSSNFRQERRLQMALSQAKEVLKKLQDMPDYDASLFHRIGRCFMNSDRYWEASVAFERVVDEAQDEKIREAAHFDLILVLARMRRFDDLINEADRYLAKYE